MKNPIKLTGLLTALVALLLVPGLVSVASAASPRLVMLSSCESLADPSLQLVSLEGEPLAAGDGYFAYKDLGDGRAIAFRPIASDIDALAAEISRAKPGDPSELQAQKRYWLAAAKEPCVFDQKNKVCKGKCKRKNYRCKINEEYDITHGVPERVEDLCNCKKSDE